METKVFILYEGRLYEGILHNQMVLINSNAYSWLSINEIDGYWTEQELIELLTLNKKDYDKRV